MKYPMAMAFLMGVLFALFVVSFVLLMAKPVHSAVLIIG